MFSLNFKEAEAVGVSWELWPHTATLVLLPFNKTANSAFLKRRSLEGEENQEEEH